MRGGPWWWVLVLLVVGWSGMAMGAEPDPEAVRRLMEKYEWKEPAKQAPASKPQPKPAPAVDHDREAWQSAEKCGTAACFRAYLEDYPKGRYARMAKARLKAESAPSTPAPTPPVAAPAVPPRPAQTLLADRYRDNGDGTVTDVRTGLQWMRCSLGQTWQGRTCTGEAKKYTWQAAMDAAATLNRQGGYAGYGDWRVPAIEELRTLVYCSSGQPKTWNDTGKLCTGNYKRPALYQRAFPNTLVSWYWSSSPDADLPELAWGISFYVGGVLPPPKSNVYPTLLVRGGQ